MEPATAWAEWEAATGGAIDPAAERRRLWTLEVRRLPIVDFRDAAVSAALGVDLGELATGWVASQALAARLRAAGALGAVVPSAARPGQWNLVVFPDGFGRVSVSGGRTMRPAPPSD